MKIKIKHRYTGKVLFSCKATSIKEAVEKAIKAKADLRCSDLHGSDLRFSDLHGSDLRDSDLSDSCLIGSDLCHSCLRGSDLRHSRLRFSDLCYSDLRFSDLRHSDLLGSDMTGSNLRGSDLDYACWPLWCGSKKVKVDATIAAQLAAHFCALKCEDKEYQKARKAILKFAMTSHRAKDLGIGNETKESKII